MRIWVSATLAAALFMFLGTVAGLPAVQAAEICFGKPATIMGTADNDQLTGTSGADVIVGLGGDDSIDGKGGKDRICAGSGNDIVAGGGGADRQSGGPGSDLVSFATAAHGVTVDLVAGTASGQGADTLTEFESVEGGRFADRITGDGSSNTLLGRAGSDVLSGMEGDDTLGGSTGADRLLGGPGSDFLDGGAGNDQISGGADFDVASYSFASGPVNVNLTTGVASGAGTDSLSELEAIIGSEYGDTLRAGPAGIILIGAGGNDTLVGGDGVDALEGGAGDDYINGGGNTDVASYYSSPGPIDADLGMGTVTGDGTDTLLAIESIDGSVFSDTILGDAQTNFLFGEFGDDDIDGADGLDVAIFAFAVIGVDVDLAAGTATGDGDDTLLNIEVVDGSEFGDDIKGSAGPDIVFGEAGDDAIDTRDGVDTADGGPDTDSCLNAETVSNCESTNAEMTRGLATRPYRLIAALRLTRDVQLVRSSAVAESLAR